MQRVKVVIEFTLKTDPEDEAMLKEDIFDHLQSLMEDDSLEYSVESEDEEDEEDY